MSSESNSQFFYDAQCPLCSDYIKYLQRNNVIDSEESIQLEKGLPAAIDPVKARNEMAMLDPKTGQVSYGADTVFFLIQKKVPAAKRLLRWPLVRMLGKHLYRLVSHNRRALAGSSRVEWADPSAPTFDGLYRFSFTALVLLGSALLAKAIDSYIALDVQEIIFLTTWPLVTFALTAVWIKEKSLYAISIIALSLFFGVVLGVAVCISMVALQLEQKNFYGAEVFCTATGIGFMMFYYRRRAVLGLNVTAFYILLFTLSVLASTVWIY